MRRGRRVVCGLPECGTRFTSYMHGGYPTLFCSPLCKWRAAGARRKAERRARAALRHSSACQARTRKREAKLDDRAWACDRCPRCGTRLQFDSDWLGRVYERCPTCWHLAWVGKVAADAA